MKFSLLWIALVILLATHVSENATADDDEWWRSGVFYQIYPRSFMDSDNSGEGDIQGVINKLEHLKDLGVTGTWLNPIFKSPMKDGGYDIADFRNVDPRYGSNEDLENLFKKAKELGIRIILDVVPNHTSDKHEWFIKSANREQGYENFYVWKNCLVNETTNEILEYPNNWIAVFHTRAWSYHPGRRQCYLHQFLPEQPDLNYHNKDVEQGMLDNLLYWLEKGVDGFRIDAINHMFEIDTFENQVPIDPNGDLTSYDNFYLNCTRDLDESYQVIFRWRKAMDDFAKANGQDRKFMMTEAYADIDLQIKWYGTKEVPGSHMPFNFALISDLNKDSKAGDFNDAVQSWYSRLPSDIGAEANWVLGNHDRNRIGARYSEERHESLVMMTMLLPGINVVYYGEEIRMTNNNDITWEETDDRSACQTNRSVYHLYSRDPVRTPFQWENALHAGFSRADKTWLPVHKDYPKLNLKLQKEAEKSTFKFYQHLIQLRKTDIFKYGAFRSMAINPDVFAFVRTYENQDPVAVFINLSKRTVLSARSLLKVSEIPENPRGRIIAATSTSNYNLNDTVSIDQFELGEYDAIAFVVEITSDDGTDSAITHVASFLLMIMSVLIILL